ncbi:unnamed protein product [Clonostachys rosea f. rosea IK726]|uniref:Uncharacterized protein n=1 Tax=Clonostachys rosea f. rosea IK726 TaxID=1349383 RepID=A0ACA9U9P1_BIOOC|nr:unnamed protein product [Clonostachys rosea f. rosea IK726]
MKRMTEIAIGFINTCVPSIGIRLSKRSRSKKASAKPPTTSRHRSRALRESDADRENFEWDNTKEVPLDFGGELGILYGDDLDDDAGDPALVPGECVDVHKQTSVLLRANSNDGRREGWLDVRTQGTSAEVTESGKVSQMRDISMRLADVHANRTWDRIWDGTRD